MCGSFVRVVLPEAFATLLPLVAPNAGVAMVFSAMMMLLAMVETRDHCLCHGTHSFEPSGHHE
jgi:hypothetical protein